MLFWRRRSLGAPDCTPSCTWELGYIISIRCFIRGFEIPNGERESGNEWLLKLIIYIGCNSHRLASYQWRLKESNSFAPRPAKNQRSFHRPWVHLSSGRLIREFFHECLTVRWILKNRSAVTGDQKNSHWWHSNDIFFLTFNILHCPDKLIL